MALRIVLISLMMLFLSGCTPRLDSNGCWGYTYDPGLKRGTISGKNTTYISPYRQCVDKSFPHQDTKRRPFG
jgi:hypothetical protein